MKGFAPVVQRGDGSVQRPVEYGRSELAVFEVPCSKRSEGCESVRTGVGSLWQNKKKKDKRGGG
jgi:hypothetical protein